jgi:MOSC domain-containing protein YiiM
VASILSVNAGTPVEVRWNGRSFMTSIIKRPLDARVAVRGVNLDGDDQADRSVHGGPSKAIYAYAIEDYTWWTGAESRAWPIGIFGENLTTSGVDLRALRIGERWRAGTALLEVSEPRIPCYKLGYAADDPAFPRRFAAALRYGSYFRIVEEGAVAAGDRFEREYLPEDHDVTVAEVGRIRMFAPGERKKLANVTALGLQWRGWAHMSDDEDA